MLKLKMDTIKIREYLLKACLREFYNPFESMLNNIALIFITLLASSVLITASAYAISKAGGLGRRFDGIGALSAGASSALLGYEAVPYSQLMDYLFRPGFGASLHILKVEIGGDVQSTDGTEGSHMHSADDENYARGYEWKLMVEAKRRNPNIILYGLSWGFPGWVGEGTTSPWTNSTVTYTVKWIMGAKQYYNLDIDYIGIWNERGWNKQYTLALRAAITAAGLKTKIVGHDSGWDVCDDLSKDPEWAAAVDVIGKHYPAANIQANCAGLNKTQWSSEDMTVTWDTGAQCWAREVNENYVRANLTATIAWSLTDSFYDKLLFTGTGLLRAVEPWSGYYEIGQSLWAAAHWGQFTAAGWSFLQHGKGVGLLDNGGSYVALTDTTGLALTIIVETMKHDTSQCSFSTSINYNINDQTATFQLDSSFAHVTELFVFFSNLSVIDMNQTFIYQGIIKVSSGSFTLQLPVGVFYTLSTINGTKGTYPIQTVSTPFPLPYHDDFDRYAVASEAAYFADQSGSWEIMDTGSSHGKVMRQMVTELPISWVKEAPFPYSVIGDHSWLQPMNVSVDVMIESEGTAFVAVGVLRGSFAVALGSTAVVLSINTTNNGMWQLAATTNLTNPLNFGTVSVKSGVWYTMMLSVQSNYSEGYLDGQLLGRCALNASSFRGWAGIGSSWNHVQFNNFHLESPE